MRLVFRLALACLVNMTLVWGAAAAPQILVVMGEAGGVYAEVATVLRADLGPAADVVSGVPRELFNDRTLPPDLIVTVGVAALDATLERLAVAGRGWERVPLLATLLPQVVFDARQAAPAVIRRPMSAVVLDQPVGRQMALIRRALPQARHVGVLPGPHTRPLLRQIETAAQARGLKLVVGSEVQVTEDIFPSLRGVLDTADVVLALPDAVVYNGATLQNILLTSYRARRPLVAFSPAYVKAGALLALYSTPVQVGHSAARMLRRWFLTQTLPPPRAPHEFVVTANAQVAASLGIDVEDAATLTQALRGEEKEP